MSAIPENLLRPRTEIQGLLLKGELEKLLRMAGMLHGHYCPGLALGVKAVHAGFERLEIRDNAGMEEIMAVVECNNCFVDGVQFAAGCSLGNNALVYEDLGKTAVSFYRRGESRAVRLCVRSFDIDAGSQEEKAEGDALFEKAITRREPLTDQESRRMKELWIKRSFATVEAPAGTLFTISTVDTPVFPYAPIVDSQQCATCGEKVMETKVALRHGKPMCLRCAREEYRVIAGKGIATARTVNP